MEVVKVVKVVVVVVVVEVAVLCGVPLINIDIFSFNFSLVKQVNADSSFSSSWRHGSGVAIPPLVSRSSPEKRNRISAAAEVHWQCL